MGARNTKAFAWGRKIPSPIVLLRLVLAYCLGKCSLRSTTTWATAIGLADISNVALLYRLRRCGDWLALLVGHLLATRTPKASRGRLIRIIDASSVPKAGRAAKRENGLWRIHSAFDLPSERFGQFVLTDEHGGEQLDRIAVVRGEIRLADRVHLQPDRIANVLADGGDPRFRGGRLWWCGPPGRMPAGNSGTASRLICSACLARARRIGLMFQSGSAAVAARHWRCV